MSTPSREACKDLPPRGVYAERVLTLIHDASSAQKRPKYTKQLIKYIIASKASKAVKAQDCAPSGEFAKRVLTLVHQVAGSSDKPDHAKFTEDWAALLGLDSRTTCTQIENMGNVVKTFSTTLVGSSAPHLVETSYIHGLVGIKQLDQF